MTARIRRECAANGPAGPTLLTRKVTPATDPCQYALSARTFCLHPRTLRSRSSAPGSSAPRPRWRWRAGVSRSPCSRPSRSPGWPRAARTRGSSTPASTRCRASSRRELILRSAELRDPVLDALACRCCAAVRACARATRSATSVASAGRERAAQRRRGRCCARTARWRCPGEAITDPVAYTLGARARRRRATAPSCGPGFRVAAIAARRRRALVLASAAGESVRCPRRGQLRRPSRRRGRRGSPATTRSRSIRARASSWSSTRRGGEPLERILLPVPTKRTKGVLVFPTVDGKVIAGPTAVDQEDKDDWSVRPRGARRDPAEGDGDVPAARGRRADRRLRRAAAGRTRRQLPDRRPRAAARGSSTSRRSAPPA